MASRTFLGQGRLLPPTARNPRTLSPERVDRLLANDNLNNALGPGQPLQVTPIDETGQPRRFYYPPGTNLTPTPYNGRIDFQVLRDTSRLYGLLRKCIEIRKNEMTRLPWQLLPRRGSPREKLQLMREHKGRIQKMEDFFDYPDREHTWSEWLKSVIEDHLVLDAATLYKRRTLSGKIYSLDQIDGSLIKPLLDIRGRRPVPPNAAYQQCIMGIPREDFTSDELIYALLTPVVDSPYGFCYDDCTEILTREGWKFFADLSGFEEVATRSPVGEFQWQYPSVYVHQPYVGSMYAVTSRSVDLLITPEHRMLLDSLPRGVNGKVKTHGTTSVLVAAKDVAKGYNRMNKIPMTSTWMGVEVGEQVFPATHPNGKSMTLSGDDYCALLGAYLAEGNLRAQGGVEIAQQAESKGFAAYQTLIARVMGGKSGHNGRAFILGRTCLTEHFRQFGLAHEKFIPSCIMDATPRQLRIFWDHYFLGDGHFEEQENASGRGTTTERRMRITTVSRRLADQLMEVTQKLGWSASIQERPAQDSVVITGYPSRCRVSYVVKVRFSKAMSFTMEEVPYEGTIHCVTVPNGVVYVRRNGKPAWSGNSPVEQNLPLYNLCMRWLSWSTAVFTDGSIPQMMLSAPENWTPDQIAELMELRKAIRAGDPRSQRDLEMLPHGVEAVIQNGGQAYLEFSQEIVDYLIDQTAISMDVTRQELGLDPTNSNGLGGSGRADAQENVQYRRSLLPLSTWLSQSIFNPLLKEWGLEEFRWTWPTLTDLDPSAHTQLLKDRVEAGLMTWDDALLELGQEPIGAATYFRLQPAEAFLAEDLERMVKAGGAAEYTQQNQVELQRREGEVQLTLSEKQAALALQQQQQQLAAQKDQATHEHGLAKEMAVHQSGLDQTGNQTDQQFELQKEATQHEYKLQELERQSQLQVFEAQQKAQVEEGLDEHKTELDVKKLQADHQLQLVRQEHEHAHMMSQQGLQLDSQDEQMAGDRAHQQALEAQKHQQTLEQLQAGHAHQQQMAAEDRDHQLDLLREQHLQGLEQQQRDQAHTADQQAASQDHDLDMTREQHLQAREQQRAQQQGAQEQQGTQQEHALQLAAYQHELQRQLAEQQHAHAGEDRASDQQHQLALEQEKQKGQRAKARQKQVLKGLDLGFDSLPPSLEQYSAVDTALRTAPPVVLEYLAASGWGFAVSGASATADEGVVPFDVDSAEKLVTVFDGAQHFDVLRAVGTALDESLGHISLSPGFPVLGSHARTLFGAHFAGYASHQGLVALHYPRIADFFSHLCLLLEERLNAD